MFSTQPVSYICGKVFHPPNGKDARSWPLHSEGVDLLRTDVASEDRRAVGGESQLGLTLDRVHHTAKALQAGKGLDVTIKKAQPLYLRIGSSGGENQVFAVTRNRVIFEVS